MTGSTGQILTKEKQFIDKLKEIFSTQLCVDCWNSNCHLNPSVRTKQTIMAKNMGIALYAMFCVSKNAKSEIT